MNFEKLKEQIEFYFGDSNYAKDKFMLARAAENDGFIAISTLLTFKRLQALNPTVDQIKEAVKDSEIVEVKDDSLRKIQTQKFKDYLNDGDASKRVVHISGFKPESTLDEIKEILKIKCNPVRVIMRRDANRLFKGSCFVEFSTIEEAENVLKLKNEVDASDENGGLKKQKTEFSNLEILSKEEYLLTKKNSKESKKDELFSDKVKNSFISKLYKFECNKELDIKGIKEQVKDCAFVDIPKKVIRMKFAEEWEEKEFNISKENKDEGVIKLIKMNEEESKEYLKGITIKRMGKASK